MRIFIALTSITLICSMGPTAASAYDLRANQVVEFSAVDIRNAGDGSGRLFLVGRDGLVGVMRNGELLTEPFLDIRHLVADAPARPGD